MYVLYPVHLICTVAVQVQIYKAYVLYIYRGKSGYAGQ